MYVFEFQPDHYLSFFGQAGVSKAETKMFEQTGFTGGIQLSLLPGLGFQVGIATVVNRVDGHKESEMGPLAGLNFYVPIGIFKLGTSATIIRSNALQSTALRTGVLIEL